MYRVIYKQSMLESLPDGTRMDYISYYGGKNKHGIHFVKIDGFWQLRKADKTLNPHKFEDKDFFEEGVDGFELLVVL